MFQELHRFGVFLLFVSEFRSSKICGLHLFELVKLAASPKLVNVCLTCVSALELDDDRFDRAELQRARTLINAGVLPDDVDDVVDEALPTVNVTLRRLAPALLDGKVLRTAALRAVAARHTVRRQALAAGELVWDDQQLRQSLLADVRVVREARGLPVESAHHEPSPARVLSLAGRRQQPVSAFALVQVEAVADEQDGTDVERVRRRVDVSPHDVPSLLAASRTRETATVPLTRLSTRQLFCQLTTAISRLPCCKCEIDGDGHIANRCHDCYTVQRVNRDSACSLCHISLRCKCSDGCELVALRERVK